MLEFLSLLSFWIFYFGSSEFGSKTDFFIFFSPKKSHFISLISSSCLTACHLGKALSNIKIFFWSVPERVFTSHMVALNSHMVAVIFELDLLATNW